MKIFGVKTRNFPLISTSIDSDGMKCGLYFSNKIYPSGRGESRGEAGQRHESRTPKAVGWAYKERGRCSACCTWFTPRTRPPSPPLCMFPVTSHLENTKYRNRISYFLRKHTEPETLNGLTCPTCHNTIINLENIYF